MCEGFVFVFFHNNTANRHTTPRTIAKPLTLTATLSRQDEMKARREAMRLKKDASNPKFGKRILFISVFH